MLTENFSEYCEKSFHIEMLRCMGYMPTTAYQIQEFVVRFLQILA